MSVQNIDGDGCRILGRITNNERRSAEFNKLLSMAGLPLLDGFFMASATSQLWHDLWFAVSFGLTGLSGAGCVTIAMRLKGCRSAKACQILVIYLLVLMGSMVEVLVLPVLQSMISPVHYYLTALFLFGMALTFTGIPLLQNICKLFGLL